MFPVHELAVQPVPDGYVAQPMPLALQVPLVPQLDAPMSVHAMLQQMSPSQFPAPWHWLPIVHAPPRATLPTHTLLPLQ